MAWRLVCHFGESASTRVHKESVDIVSFVVCTLFISKVFVTKHLKEAKGFSDDQISGDLYRWVQ